VSGIFAEAQFSTAACQPQSKMITFRNDDTRQPQRVMGIYFELGTNDQNLFKLDKAEVGNNEFKATASMVEEIIIPPGGLMSIQTTYTPKAITPSGSRDISYLDVFLNGPRLGILQVRLSGQADTLAPGCGTGPKGQTKSFTVNKITISTDATGIGGRSDKEITNVTDKLIITVDGTKALLTKDEFPNFSLDVPTVGSVGISLADDTLEGTTDGTNFSFDSATFSSTVGLSVAGKMSTGHVEESNTNGALSLDGSPLSPDKKMSLVFVAKIPDAAPSIGGGVIGAKFELTED